MARSETSETSTRLLTLAALMIVVAGLYLAREFLVPLALSVLLSFLLAPIAHRLERWGLRRAGSVLVVAIIAFSVLGGIGWIMAGQMVDLAGKLPQYQDNIVEKIRTLRGSSKSLGKATETLRVIEKEISEPDKKGTARPAPEVEAPRTSPAPQQPQPVPVKIVEGPNNPLGVLARFLGALAEPLATAALVGLFVIFLLVYREDVRDRVIRLIGEGQIDVATDALDEAGDRISRYLLMQFIVNATYGIPVAVGLFFIGIPNSFLWGLLATLLRYLPYIGPTIAASMPIMVAFAIGEWWQLGATIGVFVVLELISNNIMEPLLYGASAGVSPVALLAAAAFWTWLWGSIGLILSTPLTVLLVVAGKYVPQIHFLYILLGDTPVLQPSQRFYQRLLALDSEETSDLMEEYLQQMPLVKFYDTVLLPALELSEADRHDGRLDPEKQKFIQQTVMELINELGERKMSAEKQELLESAQQPQNQTDEDLKPQRVEKVPVLCVPANDDADCVAARMLSQVLEESGLKAPIVSANFSEADVIAEVTRLKSKVVCISALPPSAIAHVRQLCRALHSRFPDLTIIVGLWNTKMDFEKLKTLVNAARSDKAVGTIADAAQHVITLIKPMLAPREKPA